MKRDNMSLWMMMVLVSVMLLNEATINAKEFKVGDDLGWQEPDTNDTLVYDQWAASKRFHVGDSLCEFYFSGKKKVLLNFALIVTHYQWLLNIGFFYCFSF